MSQENKDSISSASPAAMSAVLQAPGVVCLTFSGKWTVADSYPSLKTIFEGIEAIERKPAKITLNLDSVTSWDGSLFSTLFALGSDLSSRKIEFDTTGAPEGLKRLLTLAFAVPARAAEKGTGRTGFLERVGQAACDTLSKVREILAFVGDIVIAFMRFLRGAARIRGTDLLEVIGDVGPRALPIVTLISVLVGVIFAFIGAIQLKQFGAQIYVANLVGIAMARELGAVMAGVIMSGRTGAAFAAQLGTMEVNEEIDALKTLGISPMEFLVLPRMLALIIMMPLLCLYADVAGIVGGAIVSVGALGITPLQYFEQTRIAVGLHDVWIGVVKSAAFGILIAMCGCYHGIKCGRDASSVGLAATSAVVSAIVCLVLADAVFAVLCNILGI